MSENMKLEMISRRKILSLLGLAAAASLAIPATVLTVTNADAQTQGMERRDDRRDGRQDRRDDRRNKKKKKSNSVALLQSARRVEGYRKVAPFARETATASTPRGCSIA